MLDYDYIYDEFMKGDLHPLYVHVYPGLIRYASRLLGDRLEFMAEDCVQDSILSTYQHREDLYSTERWKSWMLTTIHNRTVSIIRRASLGEHYAENYEEEIPQDKITRAIIEQETLNSIYSAVNALPEEYRKIFAMSFEEGLKIAEISELLDMAEITIKKKKAKLLNHLRSILGKDIDEAYLLALFLTPSLI